MRAPMPAPDRVLRTLTFPIQYLEVGEALARELGHDIEQLYQNWGIDLHALAHHGWRAHEALAGAFSGQRAV